VFENYIKGLVATSTPAKIGYLEAAIKLDPGFDRARLALWNVHHDEGNGQLALVTAAAIPETSPMYARARFSVALSLVQLKRLDDAFATLRALADRAPSATLMNNIGVIQLRRPVTPETGRATYYSTSATPTGPRKTHQPRFSGCARRFAATRLMAKRTRYSRLRCRPPARPPKPRASASWRRSCRRPTPSGRRSRRGRAANRFRAAWSG